MVWLLIFSLAGYAAPASRDDAVDPLALAALLLSDHRFERAHGVLDKADISAENFDLSRYYTLLGLADKGLGKWLPARNDFRKAVAAGEVEPAVHAYLAQIAFQLQDYADTIAEIDRAAVLLPRAPALWQLKAQSQWLLKQTLRAWETLETARQLFPDNDDFLRREVSYLIDLGLYQEAADMATRQLAAGHGKTVDHVAIGNALRVAKQYPLAVAFLEQAHFRFPHNALLSKVLAHAYLDWGKTNAAAEMMFQASLDDPNLLVEAAELYRRAGRLHHALYLNAQLGEEGKKLRQRMAIYLDLEQYDMVNNMVGALQRTHLLEDEDIRYALAYSCFEEADFSCMEDHLGHLSRTDLFHKAVALRQAGRRCATQAWQCMR